MVAVADTERLFQAGAVSALAATGLLDAIAVEAADGSLVARVRASGAAAVVLDAGLGKLPYAADLVAEIVAQLPGIGVVVTVGRARPAGLVEVMDAGARGVIDRQCRPDELVAAVSAVLQGRSWVAAALAALLREELAAEASGRRAPPLSPREREVLRWLAAGGTNAAIGRSLGISEHTVRNHVHSIMTKLGVRTRTDVVATAVRRGLVDIPE